VTITNQVKTLTLAWYPGTPLATLEADIRRQFGVFREAQLALYDSTGIPVVLDPSMPSGLTLTLHNTRPPISESFETVKPRALHRRANSAPSIIFPFPSTLQSTNTNGPSSPTAATDADTTSSARQHRSNSDRHDLRLPLHTQSLSGGGGTEGVTGIRERFGGKRKKSFLNLKPHYPFVEGDSQVNKTLNSVLMVLEAINCNAKKANLLDLTPLVISEVCELVSGDKCTFFLNVGKEYLWSPDITQPKQRIPIGMGLVGIVARDGCSMRLPLDPRTTNMTSSMSQHLSPSFNALLLGHSESAPVCMCVPIRSPDDQSKMLGALYVARWGSSNNSSNSNNRMEEGKDESPKQRRRRRRRGNSLPSLVGFLPPSFTEEEAQLLEIFAAHLGIAIRNIKLYEAAVKTESHYNCLSELINELALSDMEFLPRAVQQVKEVVCADRCSLFLKKPSSNVLWSRKDNENITVPLGKGLLGHCGLGRIVNVADVTKDRRFDPSVDAQSELEVKSLLCAPISWEHDVLGCVSFVNQQSELQSFGREEQSLVHTFTKLCSTCLQFAQERIENNSANTRSEGMMEIVELIVNFISTLNSVIETGVPPDEHFVENSFRAVLQKVCGVIQAERCSLFLDCSDRGGILGDVARSGEARRNHGVHIDPALLAPAMLARATQHSYSHTPRSTLHTPQTTSTIILTPDTQIHSNRSSSSHSTLTHTTEATGSTRSSCSAHSVLSHISETVGSTRSSYSSQSAETGVMISSPSSVLCVPVTDSVDNSVVGVLLALNAATGKFSLEDEHVLTIAAHFAAALLNLIDTKSAEGDEENVSEGTNEEQETSCETIYEEKVSEGRETERTSEGYSEGIPEEMEGSSSMEEDWLHGASIDVWEPSPPSRRRVGLPEELERLTVFDLSAKPSPRSSEVRVATISPPKKARRGTHVSGDAEPDDVMGMLATNRNFGRITHLFDFEGRDSGEVTITRYRTLSPHIHHETVISFDFNALDLQRDEIISHLVYFLDRLGLVDPKPEMGSGRVQTDKLLSLLAKISRLYRANPYHNFAHALDCAQAIFAFINTSNLMQTTSSLDRMAMLISALCHDIDHPGVTNQFLIGSRSPLATFYNDKAVLENYHTSVAFLILREDDSNVLADLFPAEYKHVRLMLIEGIMATDMSSHFQYIAKTKDRAKELSTKPLTNAMNDKLLVTALAMKCADLVHLVRPFPVARKWEDLLQKEFFLQGDLEKEHSLVVGPCNDRDTVNVAASQIFFYEHFGTPLFTALVELEPDLRGRLAQLQDNLEEWRKILREETLQKQVTENM
jgi:high affinity cGMP-specific 3',5'-cyclic phosphodiesterase 9